MGQTVPQSYANHTRIVPAYHLVAFPILAVNLVWTVYQLWRAFSVATIINVLVAIALLILFFCARVFALTVQDRVIKLEMRLRLERQRSARMRGGDIDIKFGAGGLLDVYFIARTLRLATGRRPARDRSTSAALAELRAAGTLAEEQFTLLSGGYEFLSRLDHHIRLSIGRSSTLPAGRPDVMSVIARRMALSGVPELAEQLTVHRLNIRASFDELLPG